MHGYFDTSLILAIVQKERSSEQALQVWEACESRCSSLLLRIESSLSVQRNLTNARAADMKVLEQKKLDLGRMLSGTFLIPVNPRIAEIVEQESRLVRCRSLDAIHLATALFLQRQTGEAIPICTYDARMRETARELGFEVLPKQP